MLFNMALHTQGFHEVLALTVSLLFIVITHAKEKRDERKRA
jgi:hypothetical protein